MHIAKVWLIVSTEVDEDRLFAVAEGWCIVIGVNIQLHVRLWLPVGSKEVVLHANIIIELSNG